jgi:hypothetical protein
MYIIDGERKESLTNVPAHFVEGVSFECEVLVDLGEEAAEAGSIFIVLLSSAWAAGSPTIPIPIGRGRGRGVIVVGSRPGSRDTTPAPAPLTLQILCSPVRLLQQTGNCMYN